MSAATLEERQGRLGLLGIQFLIRTLTCILHRLSCPQKNSGLTGKAFRAYWESRSYSGYIHFGLLGAASCSIEVPRCSRASARARRQVMGHLVQSRRWSAVATHADTYCLVVQCKIQYMEEGF